MNKDTWQKLQKLIDQVIASHHTWQKRNALEDCLNFLKITGTKWQANYEVGKLADIPTLIPVNHYIRPIYIRKNLFTTFESLISTIITTVALAKISTRKTTWAATNLNISLFFFSGKARQAQIAAIDCYDLIGTQNNYPFSNFDQWIEALDKNFNIGFYPEGKTGYFLKKNRDGYVSLINCLKEKVPKFQIVPASFWHVGKNYRIHFAKPVISQKPSDQIATLTMQTIAQNLPLHLRGYYKNISSSATTGK